MKRLDAYILKELFVPFLIGTVMIVLMFQANTYMGLARQFQLENVKVLAVFQAIFYQTPFFLSMTLPLGMALATSLTMSRIARESELTAIRAAGTPILRVLLPIACFGVVASGFHFYDVEYLLPPSMKKANQLLVRIGVVASSPTFNTNRIVNVGRYAASFGTAIRKSDSLDMDLKSIILIEHPDAETTSMILAKTGTYRNGLWTIDSPFYYQFHGTDVIAGYAHKDVTINEIIDLDSMFNPPQPDSMSITELKDAIKRAPAIGENINQLQHSLYDKFFVPLSCLVFSFVSPLFAIRFAKGGGFAGVLLSFVMALAYYNVYIVCGQILIKIATFPPLLASALPDLLFIGAGIWAARRLE